MNIKHHPSDACELVGCRGRTIATCGQKFRDRSGVEWEIVAFGKDTTYSPSEPGGTPGVFCRVTKGGLPASWKPWVEEDGTVEWCGDSVATMILSHQ